MPADPPADPISAALERQLLQYAAAVRRIGARHGLRGADLDEVVQEVRIRLWRALGTDEKISTASASYLYRTATSAALDLLRRRRVRQADSIDDGETAETLLAPQGSLVSSTVESEELVEQVSKSVAELAPGRREVVRMYLAGYDRAEIGSLFGWSEARTRNLLYRGLGDLRGLLQDKGIRPEMAQ